MAIVLLSWYSWFFFLYPYRHPYNTGKDGFVYPDKFEYSNEILKDIFGLNEDELNKLKTIQGKSTHSAWLTFMYTRLKLSIRLLKEDGLIYIYLLMIMSRVI